ncbi:MAG TPA: hypothetical protein VEZ19_14980 [Rubrobacter sp.]|nr:hypothetical protein [Rubrobacter sp.]
MSVPLRPPPPGYWALAPTLAQLRRELLFAYEAPSSSYGTIADKRHQARKSDHRPDQRRYVRALDVPGAEHGGPPLRLLAMLLRLMGESGSQRLNPGGYVIHNHRIASEVQGWSWRPYSGDNPHVGHLHVSCSLLPQFYVLQHRWNVVAQIAALRQAES